MQATITLGDTLNFTTSVPDFLPSAGWVLKFRLVPRSTGSAIALSSTADGDLHRTQVPAATTAGWAAGTYSWASYVEKGAESYSVDKGVITLLADPRTASAGLDVRTPNEIALDNVDAALSGKASSGVMSYRIGERELRSYSMAELLQLRSHLVTQVRNEQDAARQAKGLASRRQVFVRMGRYG